MRIDELNTPVTKYEYSDFASYYEPMQITKEQKEKRTETAHDLFFDFLMLFVLISQSIEAGDLDYMFILQQFQDMYSETVNKYARTDDYTREYVDSFTRETMDTTWSHLDLSEEQSYWLSDDRASILALNESNTINNYEDLQKAKDEGKNVKIWKTMNDTRVRDSHKELEGQKIGIDEYFHVGSSLLLFPRDYVHCSNIRDIAGCRCSVKPDYDPKYEKAQDRVVDIKQKNDIMKTEEGMDRPKTEYKAEPMPKSQFQKIVKAFKRNGGAIITDNYAQEMLDAQGANGITLSADLILFRKRPSRATVFEELIHTAQYRTGRCDGSALKVAICEVEAKEKLLRYSKEYKLTKFEIEETKRLLENDRLTLKELIGE